MTPNTLATMAPAPRTAQVGSFRGEAFACASPEEASTLCKAVAGKGSQSGQSASGANGANCGNGANGTEVVSLERARGRILASDVTLPRDSPPFDHSAMDGYAIFGTALASEIALSGESFIGRAPPPLAEAGTAIRISTGAPMPTGADRVIRREDVTEHAGPRGIVTSISMSAGAIERSRAGDNVRRRGENALAGIVAVAEGTVLGGSHLGAIAACGLEAIAVHPLLRVAIVTTGDELSPTGIAAGEHAIYDSNGPALRALAQAHRWIDLCESVRFRDDPEDLAQGLRSVLPRVDALILTGGVSMGHRDPVRAALEALGASVLFHGLPQRPGKPMLAAFIERPGARPILVFALPGNPVSAMVTATRIALPTLSVLAGAAQPATAVRVALAVDDGKRLDLWWHRLVRINQSGAAEFADHRGSGDLIGSASSDGFVEIPPKGHDGPDQLKGTALYFPWPR